MKIRSFASLDEREKRVAIIGGVVIGLIALETLLGLILEIYRVRVRGWGGHEALRVPSAPAGHQAMSV